MFFAYLSLVMVVVQGPILARASRKLSDSALAFGGSLILAIGFAGLLRKGSFDNPSIYFQST